MMQHLAGLPFEVNRPDRKRNFDPFLAVTLMQAFHKLMPEEMLVSEFLTAQNHVEIDAEVGKGMETDEGFKVRHPALDLL
jgi:hypothetical protein